MMQEKPQTNARCVMSSAAASDTSTFFPFDRPCPFLLNHPPDDVPEFTFVSARRRRGARARANERARGVCRGS